MCFEIIYEDERGDLHRITTVDTNVEELRNKLLDFCGEYPKLISIYRC